MKIFKYEEYTIAQDSKRDFTIVEKNNNFFKLDNATFDSLFGKEKLEFVKNDKDNILYMMGMIFMILLTLYLYFRTTTYSIIDVNFLPATLVLIINIFIHELGHVLFLKKFYPKSRVKIGFKFMFIWPAFYVDTSYSYMVSKYKRIAIYLAGNFMNCIYVSEIFRSVGMMTNILTPFECGSFTKLFSKDRANKYFAKGMVVFFAGGTGHPYFSTDTGVVLRAIEVEADVILLAKAIDGVYNADPAKDPTAKKYDEVSIDEVIAKNLQVVDMTASILARDNKMPMWVFGLNEENSIVNTLKGKFNGTKVTV